MTASTTPLDPQIACFVLGLATKMCKYYDHEAGRAQAFRDWIWERFGIKLEAAKVADTPFATDGHASVGFYVYVNTVCKNEIGSTPTNPCLKSAIFYHHHTRYSITKLQNSRFPCLHIYYFHKEIHHSGSVDTDALFKDPILVLQVRPSAIACITSPSQC